LFLAIHAKGGESNRPKAKGPHHHFQKLFHKKEEIISTSIIFKGEEIISIAKTLLTAKGRTSSEGAFI
jgi:hypothetical protein